MLARVTAALAAALVLAAAAEGKLYLDERFDGAGLPEGWTYRIEKTAGWSINSGGPWGNYLYMYAVGYPHVGDGRINVYPHVGDGRINVDTKHVGVAAGSIYYRFRTYRTWSGYTLVGSSWFYFYQEGTSAPLASFSITNPSWQVKEGSVTAAGRPVYLRWYVTAGYWLSHGCSVALRVDTVQLSSVPMTGVAPASLGRVKALFQ
jgi:hypothetical protein